LMFIAKDVSAPAPRDMRDGRALPRATRSRIAGVVGQIR